MTIAGASAAASEASLCAPPRYELLTRLGRGGGGEVWSARDRISGDSVAFKVIRDGSSVSTAEGSSDDEMLALVREAVALSGLEGLGAPRVLRFGRLRDGRAYLVRDLVEGQSLAEVAASTDGAARAIAAVADAADRLTRLHRADLLHGDVKPANIIVGASGARFVDFGLAARFREGAEAEGEEAGGGGALALGMTPKFAAPELLAGGPLTIRAEVFALGRTLRDVLDRVVDSVDRHVRLALLEVAAKATETQPAQRYPSAEEFALAVRRAAHISETSRGVLGEEPVGFWPILALDRPTDALATRIAELPPSRGLVIAGPPGSGRTTLLRRVAWSLGVRDAHVAHVEAKGLADAVGALEIELAPYDDIPSVLLLIDDFHELGPLAIARVEELRQKGARLAIVTGGEGVPDLGGPTFGVYQVAPLADDVASDLLHRAMPSLGEAAVLHVVRAAGARPGRIREIVDMLGATPVVTARDVDRALEDAQRARASNAPKPALFRAGGPGALPATDAIRNALDRGHFEEAAELLAETEGEETLDLAVARSRLATNRGEPRRALADLAPFEDEALASVGRGPAEWALHAARAHLRAGEYESAEARGRDVSSRLGDLRGSPAGDLIEAEALAVVGLAHGFMSRFEEAQAALSDSVVIADRSKSARVLSLAYGSLGFVLQRFDKLDEARAAYTDALREAERAGDAGSVATTRLNLATIAKTRGDLGDALVHLEAAVDMGKRSGRTSTLRLALVNLANLDLYIGRVAKAAASIAELAKDRAQLPKQLAARLLSLEAEAAERDGDPRAAYELCGRCAEAYDDVAHPADAAEARLWGVLFALDLPVVDLGALRADVEAAREAIAGATAHHALLEVAEGRLLARADDLSGAAEAFDRAIAAAEREKLREWRVRALEARADIAQRQGDVGSARRMREEAVAILESISRELPRDLAEVFWNDDRRRTLRAAREAVSIAPVSVAMDRFGRVLEINREIAGTYDLPRLLARITDHAVALLSAERGFVILKSRRSEAEGALSVHASREASFVESGGSLNPLQGDGEAVAHTRFSRSIADRVIATGEPVVTTSARDDARTAGYVSVHQLMLESIACVPIRSRSSGIIGALYLETRLRPGNRFKAELPLLVAFADQVAIAIETARLVSENERRAAELARANQELEVAKQRIAETLDHRTAQLHATRQDLKTTRAVLKGHFGYQGLVGTSEAMRKLYALVDRVKDTDVPVLITGESGTGKEMVARAIHNGGARAKQSPRGHSAPRPFVGINCGAVPEHLLESELFGHVRGAFTGAERDRRGLFLEATEGTLLLDEIGEMGSKMQAALLRVLQEKVVRPVGSAVEEPTGARVVAATHRDLAALVEAGTFREDLFYRLSVIPVLVPPLRDRLEDIPILIDHFLGIFAARYSRERRSVSRDAKKLLMSYRWPGNVRQLENALLNAWVLSDAPELEVEDFSMFEPAARGQATPLVRTPPSATAPPPRALQSPTSLEQHRHDEKERIVAALASANWNRVKAAELVGMPRRTFYRRLKEYGIQ